MATQPMTVAARVNAGIIWVTASGIATEEFADELIRLIQQHGVGFSPVLTVVDVREFIFPQSIFDMDEVLRKVIEARMHLNHRVAFFYTPTIPLQTLRFRYLATICNSHGVVLEVFTDEAECVVWLQKP